MTTFNWEQITHLNWDELSDLPWELTIVTSGRVLSVAMDDEVRKVGGEVISPFLLFEANLDSGDLNFWTGVGDLVWNSTTYSGSGDAIRLQPAEETQDLRATGAQCIIAGISSAILAAVLAEPFQQRPCRIRMGALDRSNDPPSVIVDPLLMFDGRLDQMNWTDEGDTATIVVTAESRLIDLENPRERRLTPEDQKQLYPGDTSLDRVPALQNREIVLTN